MHDGRAVVGGKEMVGARHKGSGVVGIWVCASTEFAMNPKLIELIDGGAAR